jgi:hypothetical protein
MTKEERVSKVLNDFLQSQGYSNVIAQYIELSDSYYLATGQIVLGGLADVKADEIFVEYCERDLGLKVNISVETLAFLHELGHHNTLVFIDDIDIIASDVIKEILYMQAEETEEAFMEYFTCPVEQEATVDAVNFCNHNPEVVMQLDKDLLAALYE